MLNTPLPAIIDLEGDFLPRKLPPVIDARMIEQFDNLWLDTTMMLAGYLPCANIPDLWDLRPDRIMFGTDFPNLPYAWDREIKHLAQMSLPQRLLSKILHENALDFFKIPLDPAADLG